MAGDAPAGQKGLILGDQSPSRFFSVLSVLPYTSLPLLLH
jgi:hypothetical protein